MGQFKKLNLKSEAFLMLGLLLIQFILGMLSNLFVEFPKNGDEWKMWEFAKSQLPLKIHIIFGMILLAGSIVMLIHSIKSRFKSWILTSAVGLISIFGAIVCGALFIDFQNDMLSLFMAVFFILAVFSYFFGLYSYKNSIK